jgi:Ca2+-binding EF-hand superfamily protein
MMACREADLRAAFNQCDLDGSGFITLDELKKVLKSQGYNADNAVLDMDVDGDGKVNFNEFLQSFRENL